MSIEKLFKKNTTINISVVKLENKKLTKGVFNQINRKSPFDKLYELKENVSFLGYVNDANKWVIWTDDKSLYKYKFVDFFNLSRIDFHRNTIEELFKVYPSQELELLNSYQNDLGNYEYQGLQISQVLKPNEQYVIIEKKEYLEKIIDELLKRQIFL